MREDNFSQHATGINLLALNAPVEVDAFAEELRASQELDVESTKPT